MQLMVEGDKWEMFIPSDLAYGDGDRPPKVDEGNAVILPQSSLPSGVLYRLQTESQFAVMLSGSTRVQIGGGDCLIFTMEIMKIKGGSKPKEL